MLNNVGERKERGTRYSLFAGLLIDLEHGSVSMIMLYSMLHATCVYIYVINDVYCVFTLKERHFLVLLVSLLALAWSTVLITVILIVAGYNIIPIVFERIPLDIKTNEFYRRGLSWSERNEDDAIYEVNE